jgi:hypothetical protein
MKTKIRNYGTIALFIAFSFMTTVALAGTEKKDPPAAELKYIGNVKNQPVFQLDLNSPQEDEFLISIKDQFGETLYSEKVKAKVFVRKFRLDTDNLNDAVLRVEVRTAKNHKPAVFTINRSSRFIEEASVSKL